VSRRSEASVVRCEIAPELLLKAIIETSDEAILTCDALRRVLSWGTTSERLFGRPAGAVLGRPLSDLFPEHLQAEVRAVVTTVLAGDWIKHFETEVLRPDGMPMPVSLSLCPLHQPDGEPAGVVVIVRDVTEQHLAQAMLAEVEARLEEGEAMAHVGSWLWDLRTGAVQWSAEFHRLHGIEPVDFAGTFASHLAVVHPEDRERLRAVMEHSVCSKRPFETEYRVVRPDGLVRLLRVRAQPTIGSAGVAVGLRGIGQEISERSVSEVTPSRQES
jgi:PAS domain S-box-containing protein